MRNKLWIITGVALLGILYSGYAYLQPRPIEQEYNSMIYSNDNDFTKRTTMRLKGDLYQKIVGGGRIQAELTADDEFSYKVTLEKQDDHYFGAIILIALGEQASTHTIGTVMLSEELDKAWLKLDEVNDKYQLVEGYISGPASSREAALQVAREVMGAPE
ncbi:hypothetical protein [Paenibacillus donghaensis]|uniref:Uncharacterized protein n=1 Tax=Paenibacillus donghaensis TaxID=414771 RepID=A0A2Z2KI11_9BACL|nr:hypothetical protein [Paenibacillus donghaensis]ASA19431.1 hypothetical protein B9T62_00320 [Paenibacillus donghaensis]